VRYSEKAIASSSGSELAQSLMKRKKNKKRAFLVALNPDITQTLKYERKNVKHHCIQGCGSGNGENG